jgi:hypothetical protein
MFHIGGSFLIQFLIGVVLQQWTGQAGHYPIIAYQAAFALNVALQTAALAWFVLQRIRSVGPFVFLEASSARPFASAIPLTLPRPTGKPDDHGSDSARSPDLDLALAPPAALRSRSRPAAVGSLAMVMPAVAVAALMATGQLSLPDMWSRHSNSVELALTPRGMAPHAPATRSEPSIPRLNVQALRETTGEAASQDVTPQGRADGGVVLVSSVAAITTLSAGSAVGANAQQAPAPASDLGNTWILPSKGFVAAVEQLQLAATIARQPNGAGWVCTSVAGQWPTSTSTAVAASAMPAILLALSIAAVPVTAAVPEQRPQLAPVPRPAVTPVEGRLDEDEVASLLKRGKEFVAYGDLAAARLVLRRAAESSDADAALALAATYDPLALRELRFHGLSGDVAMARTWYEKALDLGSVEARRHLKALARASSGTCGTIGRPSQDPASCAEIRRR